jgi:cephalosporin hydroxylase
MINTGGNSKIALSTDEGTIACNLYSPEGMNLVAQLWMKLSMQYRRMYDVSWLGIPIVQLPEDIVTMQELLWRTRPDVVVETGIAHGGSLILSASILELMGHGKVVGVDVEIRKHNRVAMDAHPLRHRIHLIEGSSTSPEVVEQVRAHCAGASRVLVLLDSNHQREHVARELELYHSLVTPDSYIVAMDGAQGFAWDLPRGKPEWRDDNPLPAIAEFLKRHPEFVVDPHWTRLGITSSPDGYLRRVPLESAGGSR